MSLDSKILGEEIKRIRVRKGLTQADLAKGICTQAAISGIESGRTFPSIDILYYLSLRLQVSMDYFFEKITFRQEQYINDTYTYMEKLIKEDKFEELLELCNFELKRESGYKDQSLEIYLKWQRAVASHELDLSTWKECVLELQSLLQNDHYSIKQQFLNIRIKNSLGNVLASKGQYKEALQIYKEILEEDVNMDGYDRMKLKVFFNLSKTFYIMENYEESYHYSIEGIQLSLLKEDLSMLGSLYVQAGQSLFRMQGNKEKIMNLYENATFIFKIYGRDDYINVVKKLQAML